jgi:hypothetical protein
MVAIHPPIETNIPRLNPSMSSGQAGKEQGPMLRLPALSLVEAWAPHDGHRALYYIAGQEQ